MKIENNKIVIINAGIEREFCILKTEEFEGYKIHVVKRGLSQLLKSLYSGVIEFENKKLVMGSEGNCSIDSAITATHKHIDAFRYFFERKK